MSQQDEIPFNGLPEGDDFSDTEIIETEVSVKDFATFDYTRDVPAPDIALKIGGEVYGTLGNFSLLIGKAKSKKTFLSVLVMAACIGTITGASLLEGLLPKGKRRVVFVDSEQGAYHLHRTANRVTRLTRIPQPDNFNVYAGRSLDTEQRKQLLDEIIASTPDLGLLVIDGIRDFVTSINDEEQASEIANWLLKQTEENQIHIIVVLHQNKGDFNARGHLGTELVNKAETTVSVTVEKDKDISRVEAEYARNKPFAPFALRINDAGLPEIVEDWVPKNENAPKNEKYAPFELAEYKHTEILQQIDRYVDKSSYSELLQQIKAAVSEKVQKIGDTKAKEYYTHYSNEGFIKKHGKDRSPKTYYTVHPYGHNEE